MLIVVIFILGLIVGSFLNVLILRTWRKEEIISKPSHCYQCQQKLKWFDLIPLVSFFILKGKCHYCQTKISWQYPLVELATGFLFVFIIQKFPFTLYPFPLTLIYLVLVSLLIAMFVFDWKHFVIPDRFLYPAILLSLIIVLFDLSTIFNHLLAGTGAAGFFALLVFGSKGRAMGSGDIYLAAIVGFLLGFPEVMIALILAFFAGALVGLWQIIINKRSLKTHIPFGPFLIGALIFVMLWGSFVSDLYLGLLGV